MSYLLDKLKLVGFVLVYLGPLITMKALDLAGVTLTLPIWCVLIVWTTASMFMMIRYQLAARNK